MNSIFDEIFSFPKKLSLLTMKLAFNISNIQGDHIDLKHTLMKLNRM